VAWHGEEMVRYLLTPAGSEHFEKAKAAEAKEAEAPALDLLSAVLRRTLAGPIDTVDIAELRQAVKETGRPA